LNAAKSSFQKAVSKVGTGSFEKKSEKKKVKLLYEKAHEQFFRRYKRENYFHEVFDNGNYNCVSATAIYSLLFDEFNIPYAIQAQPTHVYLVAYPETFNLVVESTDPVTGYLEYNRKFKENYIKQLTQLNMIDPGVAQQQSLDELFSTYFFNHININIHELTGLQYANNGIYAYEDKEYDKAIYQLEKALFIYPDVKVAFVLVGAYSSKLAETLYENSQHVEYLIRLSRYENLGVKPEHITYEFARITREYLLKLNEIGRYDSIYNALSNRIENDLVRRNMKEIYHVEKGRIAFNNLDYDKALDHFATLLTSEPTNNEYKSNYINAVIMKISNVTNPENALVYVKQVEDSFPSIQTDNKYMNFKIEVYANLMSIAYDLNQFRKGEHYRTTMEKLMNKTKVLEVLQNNIGIAYAKAGSSYFRTGQRTKAKSLFEKGLEYAPNHFELETRLKILNQ
jgi:tetratricopeptide (TPR) repeat protein